MLDIAADSKQIDVLRAAVRAFGPIRRYLEVGVQEGRTLQAVVEAAGPDLIELVLCDTWGTESGGTGRGSHAHIDRLLEALGYHNPVVYLDGRSQDLLPGLKTCCLLAPFDLVHIDGEHTYEATRGDLEHGWGMTRRALVVHDLCIPEVWAAVLVFGKAHGGEADCCTFYGGHGTALFLRRSHAG